MQGVFHREDIGDIDLVWGNDRAGLQHIITKHINQQNDFNSINEMVDAIEQTLKDGALEQQKNGNYRVKTNNYTVAIAKDNNGNWVITAFDNTRKQVEKTDSSDTTRLHQSNTKGENGELVSPDESSAGKDNTKSLTERIKSGEILSQNAEETLVDLYSNMSKEDAQEVVNGIIKQTQDRQKQLAKKTINYEDIDKFQQHKKQVRETEKKLAYWNDVKSLFTAPLSQEEEVQSLKSIKEKEGALGQAYSIREYILRNLALGAKFLWNDSENGTKGLGSHLGLREAKEERRNYYAFLNGKDRKAVYPEVYAENLLIDVRENINPNVSFDEVFNEMIDCLSSYSTPTAMMDEAVRMHYEAEDNLTQNDFEKQQQAMIDRAEKIEEDRIQDELNKQEALSEEDYERMRQGFDEQEKASETDNQGNPIDEEGKLITEKVNSIDDITDGDFTNPTRSIELPTLPPKVQNAIGTDGKPVIIKKNIFEKNKESHKDVTPADSREILKSALYDTKLYGQNQKATKPYNWVVINTKDENGLNRIVLLEVKDSKNNIEIVHWHYIDERGLEKIKRQADREGGQLLILPSEEEAGALSSRTDDLSSAGKDTTVSENEQEKGEKNDKDTLKEDRSVKNITESESGREGMLGVVLDALRKAIGKENVITDSEEAQRVIDEQNGIVRPERVAEESKERAERVKNDLDLRRELKEITGAEGYGTNTAYVRGTSQDGTTYEVRVGNHVANFENFDRNNEELPQKIVSIVVMDEKFDKKTARYKSSEEINRELEEKNIDSEFQQIIIDDVKNKSQEEIQQAIEDVLFGMQVLKERGRLLFDSESAISYSKVQKNILETVSISNNKKHQQTVVSSNDGAKILRNLDTLVKKIENLEQSPIKTFIGEVAKAIGAKRYGSKSEYATFETKNGKIVTIRLADHNAKVSGFDHNDHSNGISVVISAKGNEGITNDGNAHIVEYYYDAIKLRRAEGKPLAEIVRSIKQSLYSGEFKDTTGLAEREEVNASGSVLKLHKVYHGSGADFEAFDHSHMGEGEGNQAYGWGTYVTEVEGIGKTYAGAAAGLKGISYKGMTGEEVYDRADESPELDAASSVINSLLKGMDVESAINEAFKHHSKMGENEPAEEIKKLNPNDFAVISDRILYTVEIPDDNGKNYLHYDKADVKTNEKVKQELITKLLQTEEYKGHEKELKQELSAINENTTGRGLYGTLQSYLGDKEASEFLSSLGFIGLSYPAQYRSGGREDGAKNYVIFNEKDLKITDKVQFFKTKDGEAYGFTVGGKVYVDERIADASTPIHEYTHLWAEALRKVNPKEWQNIVSLMKKQTHLWDKVKKDYPELKTDDEIADEVLAHYSGERGKKLLDEEYDKIRGNNKMNIFDKAKMLQAINNVREALRKFWKGVADFLGIHFTSAEEVADKVLSDLLEGVNPNEVKSEEEKIIERAKADGTYMKAPNGKKSNLNEKQWVQVRTKAFKKWFGDWELAARVINIVKGVKEHGFKSFNEATEWAKENIVKTYNSEETGGKGEIRISNGAITKYLSNSAVAKSDNKDVHLSVLKILPEVIKESIDAEQHFDYKKGEDGERRQENGENRDVVMHRLYGAVEIDGKIYRVKTTLKENIKTKETQKAYSYEVTKIELLAGQNEDVTKTSSRYSNNSITGAKLLQDVEKSHKKGEKLLDSSKIVDENGEPKVVYHGSARSFSVFDESKIGSTTGDMSGFYFSSDRGIAKQYYSKEAGSYVNNFKLLLGIGGLKSTIYDVFINARNPHIEDFNGKSDTKGREQIIKNAKKEGYDCVILKNIVDGPSVIQDVYVAFSPNQIKSATDNVGTFDSENTDIRFHKSTERVVEKATDKALEEVKDPILKRTYKGILKESTKDKWASFADDYHALRVMEDKVIEEMRKRDPKFRLHHSVYEQQIAAKAATQAGQVPVPCSLFLVINLDYIILTTATEVSIRRRNGR